MELHQKNKGVRISKKMAYLVGQSREHHARTVGCVNLVEFGLSFFPLNLVLFPLTVVEWWLRYQVTFGGTPGGAAGA